MASENIRLVRRVFHDWNASGTPPPPELITEDFELHSPMAAERGEPYRGPQGVGEWVRELNERYGGFAFELDELEEHGERVLALGRVEIEGRGTAAGMAEPAAWVIELRDGRLARMELFSEQAAARAAVAR